MKTYKALYIGILAAALTSGSPAQNTAQSTAKEPAYFSDVMALQSANPAVVERGYIAALRSENEGVIESALAHIASLKLAYPVPEFGSLRTAVGKVAKNGPSQEIRYKAYLVASLLKNPGQFAAAARAEYSSPDELFGALASRQQMVASSIGK